MEVIQIWLLFRPCF